jgi:hypothetical protein
MIIPQKEEFMIGTNAERLHERVSAPFPGRVTP